MASSGSAGAPVFRSSGVDQQVDEATSTLDRLRKMQMQEAGAPAHHVSLGNRTVDVHGTPPSVLEKPAGPVIRVSLGPNDATTASQPTTAQPAPVQAPANQQPVPTAERSDTDIQDREDASVGDAGFPQQPSESIAPPPASAGIMSGFGLFGGGGSKEADADKAAAEGSGSASATQEGEPKGIGATVMSALGFGGGSTDKDGADDTAEERSGAPSADDSASGETGNLRSTGQTTSGQARGGDAAGVTPGAASAFAAGSGPATGSSRGAAVGPRASSASRLASAPSAPGDADYEWLADLLDKMWPYISAAVTKEARVQLPDLIQASKPTWMGSIKLHKLELGKTPPKLTDIKVVKDEGSKGLTGDGYIHLEVDFDWDSQQDVEMDVAPISDKIKYVPGFISKTLNKATEFRCGIENFEMFGRLMISFRPMMHQLPVVGGIQVCFEDQPSFDFDITLGTGNTKLLDTLPALKSWLYSFISDTLLAPYVLPDHYFYPMDPAAPDLQVPVGFVEAEVLEATKVPKMDYFKGSDVYVEVSSHKRGAKTTKVADSSRHPRWSETFKLPINVPSKQHITFIMYDQDIGGDDEIGRAIFPTKELHAGQPQDLWLPIKPLMHAEKDENEEGADGVHKQKKDKDRVKSKRERFKKALTKPLVGPPNPEQKGTSLHVRLTYKELSPEQVKAVMDAEQTKEPITDPFLKELLAEDAPAGVVAGDRAQQTNPAPTDDKEATADKAAAAGTDGGGGSYSVQKNSQGVEMLTERARPESADPEVAKHGEVKLAN